MGDLGLAGRHHVLAGNDGDVAKGEHHAEVRDGRRAACEQARLSPASRSDRLWDAYNATLELDGRYRQIVQMAKVVSDDTPGFWLYFDYQAKAQLAVLRGPVDAPILSAGSAWDIHAWELR